MIVDCGFGLKQLASLVMCIMLMLLKMLLDVCQYMWCVVLCLLFSPAMTSSKTSSSKLRTRDSFEDFEEKTNDAWDDADDDLIEMSNFRMSLKDIQSTALQVIRNHSQQRLSEMTTAQIDTPSRPAGAEGWSGDNGTPVAKNYTNGGTNFTKDHLIALSVSNSPGKQHKLLLLEPSYLIPELSCICVATWNIDGTTVKNIHDTSHWNKPSEKEQKCLRCNVYSTLLHMLALLFAMQMNQILCRSSLVLECTCILHVLGGTIVVLNLPSFMRLLPKRKAPPNIDLQLWLLTANQTDNVLKVSLQINVYLNH